MPSSIRAVGFEEDVDKEIVDGRRRRRARDGGSACPNRRARRQAASRKHVIIDLYYWPTPNGHKITIFFEEAGLSYEIKPVDISAGDQFKPELRSFSPNNRMPAIVDRAPADGGEPITVFESGAILVDLAEKTGRFMSHEVRGRKTALEWVFWQVGGLGPKAGQNHHFVQYAPERIPYAMDVKETNRLYGVLDRRLAGRNARAASCRPCL